MVDFSREEMSLIEGTALELKVLKEKWGGAVVDFDFADILIVASGLQLALKHPELDPSQVENMTRLVVFFADIFKGCPCLTEMIRRGWDE